MTLPFRFAQDEMVQISAIAVLNAIRLRDHRIIVRSDFPLVSSIMRTLHSGRAHAATNPAQETVSQPAWFVNCPPFYVERVAGI